MGRIVSEETRRRISESVRGVNHPNYGTHRSEETRKRISEALKGHVTSDETRKKLSDSHRGKRKEFSREARLRMLGSHGYRVAQYSLNGELMREWRCIAEVSRALGLGYGSVRRACISDGVKSCGGFLWRYV